MAEITADGLSCRNITKAELHLPHDFIKAFPNCCSTINSNKLSLCVDQVSESTDIANMLPYYQIVIQACKTTPQCKNADLRLGNIKCPQTSLMQLQLSSRVYPTLPECGKLLNLNL